MSGLPLANQDLKSRERFWCCWTGGGVCHRGLVWLVTVAVLSPLCVHACTRVQCAALSAHCASLREEPLPWQHQAKSGRVPLSLTRSRPLALPLCVFHLLSGYSTFFTVHGSREQSGRLSNGRVSYLLHNAQPSFFCHGGPSALTGTPLGFSGKRTPGQ